MNHAPPWLAFYDSVPPHLAYPALTLYEALAASAARTPENIAWEFFGRRSTYRALLAAVDRCAAVLTGLGLQAGDTLLAIMPTTPQAVIAFYAANRLGARVAFIHPLSTPVEVTHYLDATRAVIVLTLDAFYPAVAAATPQHAVQTILLSRLGDYLPTLMRLGFWLTRGRHIAPIPADARVQRWHEWLDAVAPATNAPVRSQDDVAAVLFSGGTTALPKGIELTNANFVAQGMQAASWVQIAGGDSMLAILPVFHGFGLAVCVNAVLMAGGTSILVPQFSAGIVAGLIRSARPNFIVGVPTLYEALTRDASLQRADLSCLKACYCGADTLPRAVKDKFEAMVAANGGNARLLEGYGLTEAVTGIMAMPVNHYREGSIGIPFPDMLSKICAVGGIEELPPGNEGELCLSGPAVMRGYLNDAEATAQALRVHADGRTWLHTGDLARMDTDGFFYFSVRLKRMIKSSGFNVYPTQVEAVLREHPAVADACVIGVPDASQMERVVAWVVPAAGVARSAQTGDALIAHCRERLIKWSCPRDVFFIDSLPVTKVGKIDYRALVNRPRQPEEACTP